MTVHAAIVSGKRRDGTIEVAHIIQAGGALNDLTDDCSVDFLSAVVFRW
jgi:hypothetical protein